MIKALVKVSHQLYPTISGIVMFYDAFINLLINNLITGNYYGNTSCFRSNTTFGFLPM